MNKYHVRNGDEIFDEDGQEVKDIESQSPAFLEREINRASTWLVSGDPKMAQKILAPIQPLLNK